MPSRWSHAESSPSSALAFVVEHTCLKPVRYAVLASGGVLLADIHVPADVVEAVSGPKPASGQASAVHQSATAPTNAQMVDMQAQMDRVTATQKAADRQAAIDKAIADTLATKKASATPTAAALTPAGGDTMAQLQQLVDMKSQGL